MQIEMSDGSGWVNLTLVKLFTGHREDLYRVFGGSWVLRTTGPDGVEHYQRIGLEEAHSWLVRNGHYPDLFREAL